MRPRRRKSSRGTPPCRCPDRNWRNGTSTTATAGRMPMMTPTAPFPDQQHGVPEDGGVYQPRRGSVAGLHLPPGAGSRVTRAGFAGVDGVGGLLFRPSCPTVWVFRPRFAPCSISSPRNCHEPSLADRNAHPLCGTLTDRKRSIQTLRHSAAIYHVHSTRLRVAFFEEQMSLNETLGGSPCGSDDFGRGRADRRWQSRGPARIGEVEAVVREDGVDAVGHGFAEEVAGDAGRGFLAELHESEVRHPVDRDEVVELAFRRPHLGDVEPDVFSAPSGGRKASISSAVPYRASVILGSISIRPPLFLASLALITRRARLGGTPCSKISRHAARGIACAVILVPESSPQHSSHIVGAVTARSFGMDNLHVVHRLPQQQQCGGDRPEVLSRDRRLCQVDWILERRKDAGLQSRG